jgi:uncharacterized membrane protein
MNNGPVVPNPNDEVDSDSSKSVPHSEDSSASQAPFLQETQIKSERTMRLSFIGPLPPPNILRGYNEVIPGAAERILAMAENQQSHRIQIESAVVQENCKSQRRGLIFGFVITMTVVLGGFFLIYKGKSATGLISVVLALVSLVGIFIYGKQKQQSQLESQNKPFEPHTNLETHNQDTA